MAPGPGLDVRVFGPLVVRRDGVELRLGGPKERAVLAILLAAEGEAVSIDGLAEAVWGEDQPRSAVRTLHAYIARLRKVLAVTGGGADPLVTRGRSYRLVLPPDAVDAHRFVDAAALGRSLSERADPGGALAACDRALAEWGGVAYAGHEDIDRCAAASRVLDEVRRGLVEDRLEALLSLGQASDLVPALEAAVDEEPLRERRWGQLMVALYRAGRQADALRAYQRAREALVDALGVDPGPELRKLEAAILAQDGARLRTDAGHDDPVVALPAALDAAGSALVGRDPELDILLAAWRQLGSGRGGYIAVVGPEGVGKTRLVAELAARAHDGGAIICFARCDPDHRSARAVFDQALRSAGCSLMRAQADARIGEALGATIARLLSVWAATAPVLLVLDDLHEAEPEVLEVVADVAGSAGAAAALVVAVFRTEPGEAGRRAGTAQQLVVGGLEREAVSAICALYGDAWTVADIDEIHAETMGVPRDVHEVATGRARDAAVRRVGEAAGHAQLADARLSTSQQAVADEVVGIQRVIEQQRVQLAGPTDANPATVCPFRGLQTFGTDDAPWFYGRERLVAEVVARLVTRPVLCLVGASGSGKSSLLLAGVVPVLADGVLPGSASWPVVVATPRSTPAAELRARLAEATRGHRVVVVLDQLEEIFALRDDPVEQSALAELLAALVDGGGVLLAAIRADQLARLTEVPVMARLCGGNHLLVGPPTARELSDAIVRPAQRAGLVLEDGLSEEILADAQAASGVLPLVQTALLETWARRRGNLLSLEGYREAGGVSGAVARQAEALYAGLTEAQQVAARRTLLRLAEVADDGVLDLRRRVPISDVAGRLGSDARVALDAMVDQRLLTVGEDTVEVTHEALLRAWPRLRDWLEADIEGRKVHHRLEDAAREWDGGGRDPSDLLRGSRLSLTEEWAGDHEDDLSEREHDYVVASQVAAAAELTEARDQADRERRISSRLRRLLVGTVALLALALVAGAIAVQQRGAADDQRAIASAEARVAAARELSSAAIANLEADPELSALLALEAGARLGAGEPAVAHEIEETLHRAAHALRIEQRFPGVGGAVAWSADGDALAVQGPAGSGSVEVRDAMTGAHLREFRTAPGDATGVAFNVDGSMLGITGTDGVATVWDVHTGDRLHVLDGAGEAFSPSFSPDGRRFAAAWPDDDGGQSSGPDAEIPEGLVQVLDLRSGEPAHEIRTVQWVTRVSFSRDGSRLAAASANRPVGSVVDVATGAEVLSLEGHTGAIEDIEWSPNGTSIATAGTDGTARVFDAASGAQKIVLAGSGGNGIDWHPGSDRLATAGDDGIVKVWLVIEGGDRLLSTLSAHDTTTVGIVDVAFSPKGNRLATGVSGDVGVAVATIWDVGITAGAEVGNVPAVSFNWSDVAFTPDGRYLLTPQAGGAVGVWDATTLEPVRTLGTLDGGGPKVNEVPRGAPEDYAYLKPSPDGELVAALSQQASYGTGPGAGRVTVWDVESGKERFTADEGWRASEMAWSPDGDLLAIAGGIDHYPLDRPPKNGRDFVTIYDRQGELVTTIDALPAQMLYSIRFTADGESLILVIMAYGGFDPQVSRVEVWDWRTGDVEYTLPADAVLAIPDPTGRVIVTTPDAGADDQATKVWDTGSGRVIARLESSTAFVGLTFDPTGALIATANSDGTVGVWDARSGEERLTLPGHIGEATSVSFDDTGTRLASIGPDGIVRVWMLDPDRLAAMVETRLIRSFTEAECRRYLHRDSCPVER